jgi:hypothetical protein
MWTKSSGGGSINTPHLISFGILGCGGNIIALALLLFRYTCVFSSFGMIDLFLENGFGCNEDVLD